MLKLLCAVILSVLSNLASAGPLSPDQVLSGWVLAWGQTHELHAGDRSVLERAPVVVLTSREQLCQLAEVPSPCGLAALTLDNYVYIDADLQFDQVGPASILYHEFIHVIQNNLFGLSTDCMDTVRREEYARAKQIALLVKVGAPDYAEEVMRNATRKVCV